MIWVSGTVVDEVTSEMYDTFKPMVGQHAFFSEVRDQPKDGVITMDAFGKRAVQFEQTGLYHDFYRKLNITDQVSLAIRLDEREALMVTFSRETPFSKSETARLACLQPYVRAAWSNWKVSSRTQHEELLDMKRLQAYFGLSKRRAQVLRLIAKGLSNAQISNQLGLTEATVRKHIQLLFKQLGVTNRHAAAMQALNDSEGADVQVQPA
ncbi:MAG: LuxR C-terminal-related transcriptional regulator [Planctomycetota bacterium]